MADRPESAERVVALNLDVPLATKRRLQDIARELEDIHERRASMTSVLVHLVAQAEARELAEHFPEAAVRVRRRRR